MKIREHWLLAGVAFVVMSVAFGASRGLMVDAARGEKLTGGASAVSYAQSVRLVGAGI